MESSLPEPFLKNLPDVEPVPVEERRPQRRREVGAAAAAIVVDEPAPRDEGAVAGVAAEVSVEEGLDLLFELLFADFDGGVVKESGVERRRRRRVRSDPDARFELDGEDAAAKDGA